MPLSQAPSSAHLRLAAFAGRWEGEERVAGSAWTTAGDAMANVDAESLFGGFFVEQRYRQTRDGAVSFQSRNVLGFDASDESYKLYQFDSVGFVPPTPASGRWQDGALVFMRTSPRGAQRIVYQFENEDCYRMNVSFAPDGSDTWQNMVSGRYCRAHFPSLHQF
jgi:hypothetical protein